MVLFTLRRFISLIITLIFAAFATFFMMEVLPGDPAELILGLNAQPDTLEALRIQLGLNLPVHQRFFNWITGMLQGDFGTSYTYSVPVLELLQDRLKVTLPLAFLALALSTLIALPAGIMAAAKRNSATDFSVMGVTQLGIAIPNFWFAMLLVLVFAIQLRLLPSGGFPGWGNGLWPALKALLLPTLALALP
ncbi:MAG: ABC transporter permease, partial [Cohaesibacteraceae bacterium]|nr:ABC transporter permease [Cohaesibacteraceae bacterium]